MEEDKVNLWGQTLDLIHSGEISSFHPNVVVGFLQDLLEMNEELRLAKREIYTLRTGREWRERL